MIYLDHNATTPVSAEVLQAMMPFFQDCFGNASSFYRSARNARAALEASREKVARCIGASAQEIVFTGSGTESDNLAIRGLCLSFQGEGSHVITSSIEHHAVMKTCDDLEKQGFTITRLPVDSLGRVSPDDVRKSITPRTVLISIMMANNETGVIQPLQAIGELARERGIVFHTDAVQAFGKIPVKVDDLGVDLLTISAHKVYGPKGIGALYIRKGTTIAPVITGGSHERGMRAGTENIPAIAGFAQAAEAAVQHLEEESGRVAELRDLLETGIRDRIENVQVNGSTAPRVPNTSSISFASVDGESILLHLDLRGICASTGSACATGSPQPSHVLSAMGINPMLAQSTIRFSLGRENTREDVERTIEALQETIGKLRGISSIQA